MWRVLLTVAMLVALALAASWVADQPGVVQIRWQEWQVDTSVAVLLLLCALGAWVAWSVLRMLGTVIAAPRWWKRRRQEQRHERALTAITHALVALASGDRAAAHRAVAQADRALPQSPAALLLSAQLARMDGDDATTRRLLDSMLQHPETQLLAARGLSDYYVRNHAPATALPAAEQAFRLNPKSIEALTTLVGVLSRLRRWQEALLTVRQARAIPRKSRQRLEGLVALLQSIDTHAEDPTSARAFALQAARLLPAFAPAVHGLVQRARGTSDEDLAARALRAAWRQAPHPLLAEAWLDLHANDAPERVLREAVRFTRRQASHRESRFLLARAALRAGKVDLAREHLNAALAEREDMRACQQLRALAVEHAADLASAAHWAARAASALPDASWRCHTCAHVAETWEAHCPRCGGFDTFAWQTPPLRYVGAAGTSPS